MLWLRGLSAIFMVTLEIASLPLVKLFFSKSFNPTWIPASSYFCSCNNEIVWCIHRVALLPENYFECTSVLLIQKINSPMRSVFKMLSVKRTTFFLFSNFSLNLWWLYFIWYFIFFLCLVLPVWYVKKFPFTFVVMCFSISIFILFCWQIWFSIWLAIFFQKFVFCYGLHYFHDVFQSLLSLNVRASWPEDIYRHSAVSINFIFLTKKEVP